ncbi:cysteine--1-D-myo-inosityl 2-amino-2-deoxy-alpha-D-glucopyranoside ligase [Streptomyces calidiresistens]|uniref:L-cysteine:1D-myo-inositol 2-amino-2-deoxy-alpha-D-glucopyranoside ligase n=1 Tax=Streptomyces calidiresistens TaxID=1485586 RepID=A0A7W3T1A3_9ACTN|nr:cysteine--1-D-myo-inosityl 2-amino-2-deoxy-alpha-D-glucopyranoside ligase [Streptomyces calidiresistens]MBB0229077.1 cysteine--1-D-myo-inosityl 2-amino-2-deoxy-alpha-D-glucopyranoside ligase [Streptomyces calidiresistens]
MHAWPAPEVPVLPGRGRDLRIHDTATGGRIDLAPDATGDPARLYVCGITPYDATHLGHAATYTAFDLVQRVWLDTGRQVVYVQNVTDVDDPLLERAAATGEDWRDLARRETELFRDDMTALRMLPPDHYIGAVEAVPLLVPMVERLRAEGAAYDLDGDVYFSVDADPLFGGISGLDRTEMLRLSAERGGDPDRPGKKNPLDPVLWLASREGEPSWDGASLGRGRPGWHIECVAIALEHLGTGFDVQGGGSDLIFPHHEMGVAHARCLTGGRPFARAYAHAGMVAYEGGKMSKSRGNLVLVSALRREGVDPAAIRLALLAHHYREDWEWTTQDARRAKERLARWRAAVSRPDGPPAGEMLEEMRAALADDLDAPRALAAFDRWAERQEREGGGDTGAPGIASRAADALLGVAL